MTECIVETHWLLDLILDQHQPSRDLWDLAVSGKVSLLVPSMCLTEAIKNIERKRSDWLLGRDIKVTEDQLKRGEATRAPIPAAEELVVRLTELGDQIEERLWTTLDRVCGHARLLHVTQEAVALARDMADSLALTTADALVLAHVKLALADCNEFVSRDSDFRAAAAKTYIQEAGIKHYSDPAHFIEAHFH